MRVTPSFSSARVFCRACPSVCLRFGVGVGGVAPISRLPPSGQLLVIPKSSGLNQQEWKSFMWLLVHTLLIAVVTQAIIGPVTTVVGIVTLVALRSKIVERLQEWPGAARVLLAWPFYTFWFFLLCVFLGASSSPHDIGTPPPLHVGTLHGVFVFPASGFGLPAVC